MMNPWSEIRSLWLEIKVLNHMKKSIGTSILPGSWGNIRYKRKHSSSMSEMVSYEWQRAHVYWVKQKYRIFLSDAVENPKNCSLLIQGHMWCLQGSLSISQFFSLLSELHHQAAQGWHSPSLGTLLGEKMHHFSKNFNKSPRSETYWTIWVMCPPWWPGIHWLALPRVRGAGWISFSGNMCTGSEWGNAYRCKIRLYYQQKG